ncbi:DAK2 domain-containing protein [Aneurinibacillus aneurinilyticus]|uniref:DAK2 domain-containing protein n=1 Tax=Aneurinibacillus aneurinilyticus TaxID=1391 RepID=UPI0030B83A73
MRSNTLTGQALRQMYKAGAERLTQHVKKVDALNVFPVPDGDTGTNMNLTFTSGVTELEKSQEKTVEKISAIFSRGLLMGARGNSGVILSQLFRGFAKGLSGVSEADSYRLAEAFQQGVEMAYKAVMKPVEGTILTVAREAAAAARKAARSCSVEDVIETLVEAARQALANTPNQLPVLKEVGVVDSGGQGLVYIYEGFLSAVKADVTFDKPEMEAESVVAGGASLFGEAHEEMHHVIDQTNIQYGYCTEFMVHLKPDTPFLQQEFQERIGSYGDSLLVVADDDLVKVHIHAEEPGDVLSFAHRYGALDRIKIENMRLQHEEVLRRQETKQIAQAQKPDDDLERVSASSEPKKASKLYAIISVASGKGIAKIFRSLGVQIIIEGGQTMNPSTEQFMHAIEEADAERVIILPNNKNIVMAAQQAADLAGVQVAVIPSTSIPQGMSSLLAFSADEQLETNRERMSEALGYVKTGLVTYAVRDTTLNEMVIKEGDFIGIFDSNIVVSGRDPYETALRLITEMVGEEDELITLIYGTDVKGEDMKELEKRLASLYDAYEVEVHDGGQSLYPFIIAVE